MKNTRTQVLRLTCAAICLALCMVLPFLTGQIKEIGNMLSPMHIPVLLCGFICGPAYAAAVGAIAPLLRFMLFGMPKLFPTGVAMCAELAAYGVISGVLYALLPKKPASVYAALIGAMIGGLLLGIIEQVSKSVLAEFQLAQLADAVVFAVLIVVLLVKPTGILGKKINEKV